MKTFLVVAAVLIVLLAASTASAGWGYVVPARAVMVQGYWPMGPAYAYPQPVMAAYPPAVVAAPVYAAPVIVRPKMYYYGQPVRNVLRAVTP